MDLFAIALALWRHKIATFFVIVVTGAGVWYVLLVQPPQYETTASLLLVPPPGPPTNEELAADPSLRSLKFDNPYTRVYDPGVVINVVATSVGSDSSRARLAQAGADPDFQVRQTGRYGFTSPVVEIHATSDTAARAQRTAEMVIAAFKAQLTAIQASEQVDDRYHIGTRLVNSPGPGVLQASGKLRGILGVIGLGVIALFTVVSTADAIETARSRRLRNKPHAPPPI